MKTCFNYVASCLFILAILLRLNAFQEASYHYHADYSRDYLVANHIFSYCEIPLTGPDSNPIGEALSSPLYFYLLTIPLFISNNILSLGWLNFICQGFSLIAVCLLSKKMFGKETALLTLIFFGLSAEIINHSIYLWQPYIMESFLYVSFLFLILAAQQKRVFFLCSSIVMLLVAAALHNSVYALLPTHIFLTWHILRTLYHDTWEKLKIFSIYFIILFLIYLPSVINYSKNSKNTTNFTFLFSSIFSQLFSYTNNLVERTILFSKIFFITENGMLYLAYILLFFVLLCFYLYSIKEEKKAFFLVLVLLIVQFLFLLALLPPVLPNPFPHRYFIPIFGVFIIILAEIITSVSAKNYFLKVVLTLLFLYALSPNLVERSKTMAFAISKDPLHFFYLQYQPSPMVQAVKRRIIDIKYRKKKDSFGFFQFRNYDLYNQNNDIFYAALEKELGAKLTEISDTERRDYKPITNDSYIFVICAQQDQIPQCLRDFLKQNPRNQHPQLVYTDANYNIFIGHFE